MTEQPDATPPDTNAGVVPPTGHGGRTEPRIGPRLDPLLEASETLLLARDDRLPGGVGHARLVAEAMAAAADKLRLPADHARLMACAGLLHDIGCAEWPAQLLTKPGRWSGDDISRVQEHPCSGAVMLADIADLQPAGAWIEQHHERLDGRGYPYNLTAEELSLEGRLLAVIEVFAACVTWRAFRAPLTPGQTTRRLQRARAGGKALAPDDDAAGAGRFTGGKNEDSSSSDASLDPECVELVLELLSEGLPPSPLPLHERHTWPAEGVTFDSPSMREVLRKTLHDIAGSLLQSYEQLAGFSAAQTLHARLDHEFAAHELPVVLDFGVVNLRAPADWSATRIAEAARRAMSLQAQTLDDVLQRDQAARMRDFTYSRLTPLGQELAERYDLFDGLSLRYSASPPAATAIGLRNQTPPKCE